MQWRNGLGPRLGGVGKGECEMGGVGGKRGGELGERREGGSGGVKEWGWVEGGGGGGGGGGGRGDVIPLPTEISKISLTH